VDKAVDFKEFSSDEVMIREPAGIEVPMEPVEITKALRLDIPRRDKNVTARVSIINSINSSWVKAVKIFNIFFSFIVITLLMIVVWMRIPNHYQTNPKQHLLSIRCWCWTSTV
ncbi:hypothetical protein KJ637_03040, partial [Patescibacteria group bacterium]|nr:hypothetical protein [Patescibacteria group bacterium]